MTVHMPAAQAPFGASRLALFAASAVGLGVLVAVATDDLLIVRILEIAAASAAVALAARVPAYRTLLVALIAVGAAGAELAVDPTWTTALSVVLLMLFVSLGATLARELGGSSDWELGGAALPWVEQGDPPVLDMRAVGIELNRARRYQRPLGVVSIALPPAERSAIARRRMAADLAASLSLCLRQSDFLGHHGPSRLIAVLPETTGADARLLIRRIHTLLEPE